MAKRAAGEGSVYKRGKRWVGQVGSGKNREIKYFDTQREANAWRHKKVEQRRKGLVFVGSKVSLSKLVVSRILCKWNFTAATGLRNGWLTG